MAHTSSKWLERKSQPEQDWRGEDPERATEKGPASPEFEGGGSNISITRQVKTQGLKDPGQAPRPHNDVAMSIYGLRRQRQRAATCPPTPVRDDVLDT